VGVKSLIWQETAKSLQYCCVPHSVANYSMPAWSSAVWDALVKRTVKRQDTN